jgi:hypothetical protein
MKKIITIILISVAVVNPGFSQFQRYQKITAGEYFINTDPGEGKAIPISSTYGYSEADVNVNNLDAPIGSKIYVRFKSTNGSWSAPRSIQRQDYFTNSQATLQYGEYYINSDPGKGNGTPISFNSGVADITNLKLKRCDRIYFRVRDSFNRWSPSKSVKFNFKDMYQAECKVKLFSGSSTNPETMTLNAAQDSSSIFTATKNNLSAWVNDTVFVRYQTMDRFYSKWTPRPIITSDVPVELISITGKFNQTSMNVNLEWITATETNDYGFEIERTVLDKWEKIGFVKGSGTITTPQKYTFIDSLNTIVEQIPHKLKYRLKQIDFGGAFEYSPEIEVKINQRPLAYNLSQNYPNPFNPTTTINFSLAQDNHITLKIFDVLGREVMMLINEKREAGIHSLKFDASNLPSGLYFYKLQAGDFMDVKKMMILK